ASKEKFKANVGIGSWLSQLEQASNLFHIDERVTWMDIEGIPLKVWTKNTFNRIASKWGDLLHVEDQDEETFDQKLHLETSKKHEEYLLQDVTDFISESKHVAWPIVYSKP
ncbi:hypothetical protein Tco_0119998, partial [Tanacetum coccineum]